MAQMNAFTPTTAGTVALSATSASSSVAVQAAAPNLELQNAGSVTVFVRFGLGAQTAVATTDYPVLAGQSKIVSKPMDADTLAGITASGTATLYVTSGSGI